ncbi:MAG: hypothetical protein A2751_02745 [Candidatus Doudnabacteria bacterium RIFCSPHIGHO2_01_FULL_46_14]|uniref:AI-2E family transporter n=1 Tax=Candidatus Doudnabacteria bacterium RIFCSPHIGHO2_01_FULL_46_14 TaxID=1817824 RepID=A0A1F5NJQ4_9BACT|nr:MAG: hypothetical protein A2751_02745 [Candidatus Doudnabacteria bacterium RIFCSPHIGHO2_01_FULL_46_14]
MDKAKLQLYFFITLMGATLVLTFFILRPFLAPLILAATFAVIFQPWQRRLASFFPRFPSLAALAGVISIALLVLVPLTLFGFQIFQEAQSLFHSLNTVGREALPESVREQITRVVPNFSPDFERISRQVLNWVVQNLNSIFSSVFSTALSFFLFLISLFYFLRDGKKFATYLKILSPLPDQQDEKILSRLYTAINSVIKGALLIALIQGLLTGIGLTIFGVPNPVLWAGTAAIAALIPNVGTAMVLLPAIGYLYFEGEIGRAIGLAIWGVLAVGLIDNFLSPYLINRGIRIHPFLILLSVIGGLSLFGPVGFVLGPLVVSLLFALLDIHLSSSRANE